MLYECFVSDIKVNCQGFIKGSLHSLFFTCSGLSIFILFFNPAVTSKFHPATNSTYVLNSLKFRIFIVGNIVLFGLIVINFKPTASTNIPLVVYYEPAMVIPSTLSVGESIPSLNIKSSAGVQFNHISFRLPAMVASDTG